MAESTDGKVLILTSKTSSIEEAQQRYIDALERRIAALEAQPGSNSGQGDVRMLPVYEAQSIECLSKRLKLHCITYRDQRRFFRMEARHFQVESAPW
jgi:hypothetical protein